MKTYQKILIGVGCAILAPLLVLMEINRTATGIEKSNAFVDVTWPLYKSFGTYDIELAAIDEQARNAVPASKGDNRKGLVLKAEIFRYWMSFFDKNGYGYYMPKVREDLSETIYGMSYEKLTRLADVINASDQIVATLTALGGGVRELEARFRKIGGEKRLAVSEVLLRNDKKIEVAFLNASGSYENLPGFFRPEELAWWESPENSDGGYVLVTKNYPPGLPSNCSSRTEAAWLFITSDGTLEPKLFACGDAAKATQDEAASIVFVINNAAGKREYAIVVYKKDLKAGEVIYLDNSLNIIKRERLDASVIASIKKLFATDVDIAISLQSQK